MSTQQRHADTALATLYELVRRARMAQTAAELGFLVTNDSHALASYRQAVLWLADSGIHTHSGVLVPDRHAPYGQWVDRVCVYLEKAIPPSQSATHRFHCEDLPPDLRGEWSDWWPAHGLWLTLPQGEHNPTGGGLLLVRDEAWNDHELALLREWLDAWWHAFRALYRAPVWSSKRWKKTVKQQLQSVPNLPWWRQKRNRWALAVLVILVFPVRLSVLVPGELVPAHPTVIRAPLDGIVSVFHIQPNQLVRKDQPLFGFDEALIQSRVEVAEQGQATADTEYRQTSQQALIDTKVRTQLAQLAGKMEEKRSETEFLRGQLERARVLSPQDGVALFDDPSEWIGRPVTVGERIMRIASPTDNEVEAWVPLADAIDLLPGASVTLYLNASPLSPVLARVRYMAHEAVQRPDGNFAYRVRASLEESSTHRVGLKGTAKLQGPWVPLLYWILRRPLAALRVATGI